MLRDLRGFVLGVALCGACVAVAKGPKKSPSATSSAPVGVGVPKKTLAPNAANRLRIDWSDVCVFRDGAMRVTARYSVDGQTVADRYFGIDAACKSKLAGAADLCAALKPISQKAASVIQACSSDGSCNL